MTPPDVATLRRFEGRDGIETLSGFYLRQRFRPHAHDGYVLGLIERGVHSVWCRGVRHDAAGDTIAAFNPGEVHHGGAGLPFWSAVLFLSLFCTVAALFVQNAAVRRTGPTRVSFLLGTEPVFGFVFACLLLGEPVTAAALLGGGLILAGTALGLAALAPAGRVSNRSLSPKV